MSTDAARAWAGELRRVVIKIGSRVLVDERNRLDEAQIESLVGQVAGLRGRGVEVVLVSSGAIAAGLGARGLEERPSELPAQQGAAAIGQARLIGLYRSLFAVHGLHIGQVLLTHADLHARPRHLNVRNTVNWLLNHGVVPIVNENDTVAVDEIRVGDNDVLSAMVAMLVRADLLVILTTVDGLMTDLGHGSLIPLVERITEETHALAGDPGSAVSVGGMRTKIKAAEMVTKAGECCVIANGRVDDVIGQICAGMPIGTRFDPLPRRMAGRKRWIAFFDHPRGELHIDAGAARAIREHGSSLLAIGLTEVRGDFDRGAPVRVLDAAGRELARGLVNYSADEARQIVGMRTDQVAGILGVLEYDEVVHRDNLALW